MACSKGRAAARTRAPLLLVGVLLAASGCTALHVTTLPIPPSWQPMTTDYNPAAVDWASVVSACRAVGRFEKRILNFWVRASFHDALALNTTLCGSGSGPGCSGADGSVYMFADEAARPENTPWIAQSHDYIWMIAANWNASIADTTAVCAAVAVEELSGQRVKIIGRFGLADFPAGRLDAAQEAVPNELLSPAADSTDFVGFWTSKGFTVEEGVALLGSHALLKNQGCLRGIYNTDGSYAGSAQCDPATDANNCTDVRMFQWRNHYYHEACSPSLSTSQPQLLFLPGGYANMSAAEYAAALDTQTCMFSSSFYRDQVNSSISAIRSGSAPDTPALQYNVAWSDAGCAAGQSWGVQPAYCPHGSRWFYIWTDASLGQACQASAPTSLGDRLVQQAMRRFLDQATWDAVFVPAFIRMVSTSILAGSPLTHITGLECPSGYQPHPLCTSDTTTNIAINCAGCGTLGLPCSPCCQCATAVPDNVGLAAPSIINLANK